eukprot:5107855-Pyramimonas_sp.AAC.2
MSGKMQDDPKLLDKYTPLAYVLPDVIPEIAVPQNEDPSMSPDRQDINDTAVELMRQRRVSLVVRDASSGSVPQTIPLDPTALLNRFTRGTAGWKMCKYQMGGYYSGRAHACVTYQALDTLCAKVRRTLGSRA